MKIVKTYLISFSFVERTSIINDPFIYTKTSQYKLLYFFELLYLAILLREGGYILRKQYKIILQVTEVPMEHAYLIRWKIKKVVMYIVHIYAFHLTSQPTTR